MINFAVHQARAGQAGAREDFEQMLGLLVRATFGEANLVFANPGDWGIDVLVGDLNAAATVWQAKYFARGVDHAQRRQIERSFASARKAADAHGYVLKRWVLCIPVSMDGPTLQWWKRWKSIKQQDSGVIIELWDENRLRELLLRPEADDVRRHYYNPYRHDGRPSSPGPVPFNWGPTDSAAAGWLLSEVTDPFALEVHRPIQPEDPQHDIPVLPTYVPREHDAQLSALVHAAVQGHTGIAVLVGESSTGKTRACWEALHLLRHQEPEWRLWHPIDPSRPQAALQKLAAVGPRTVVWLNEAQFYLDSPASSLGEQVAAGFRELLRNPSRGPILVLATLWPSFWVNLISRSTNGNDPHAQARELLTGHDIPVPAAFTGPQLRRLGQMRDGRLAAAGPPPVS